MRKEFPVREQLLEDAHLPKDINLILWHNFDFKYRNEDKERLTLSGIITGVEHPTDSDGDLILYPLHLSIDRYPVHCFRYTGKGKRWIAILAPKLEENYNKGRWSDMEVKGTLTLIS